MSTLRARVGRLLDRAATLGRILLAVAAVTVALSGVVLALGQPRAHTLMVYAAVALAAAGVFLALPAALSTSPLTSEDTP